MDERLLRFRVGIVVVAATILSVILIILMGETPLPFLSDRYTVFMQFPNAPGVTVGTPVRKSGVRIGRVTKVELKEPHGVLVTTEIDGNRKLTNAEVVRINSESLLGDAVLEFVQSDTRPENEVVLTDGSYLEGRVGSNPLAVLVNLEDDIERALAKFNTAGDEVSQLARSLNNMVTTNEAQIQRVIDKTEYSMDQFGQAMTSVNQLVGDPQLRDNFASLENVPKLVEESRMAVAEMRTEIQQIGKSLEGFSRVANQAEKNLKDLEGLTEPLGRQGPQIVENLNSSVNSLNVLLTELAEFSQAVNNREGTLGMLAHDPDIYLKLNRTAGNLETASQRVDQIVDDVRVFTDKIARDPKQLGVAGALDKRTSGLKTPPLSFFRGQGTGESWIAPDGAEIEQYRVGDRRAP